MSSAQKTQMEMILKKKVYDKDSIVWVKDTKTEFAILVNKGSLIFYEINDEGKQVMIEGDELGAGSFAGDINAMIANVANTTNLKAQEDTEVYLISKKDMLKFLNKNPGIYLLMKNTIYIP